MLLFEFSNRNAIALVKPNIKLMFENLHGEFTGVVFLSFNFLSVRNPKFCYAVGGKLRNQ